MKTDSLRASIFMSQSSNGPMTLSQWFKARVPMDFDANLQTCQVGAHFKALNLVVSMKTLEKFFFISKLAEAQ